MTAGTPDMAARPAGQLPGATLPPAPAREVTAASDPGVPTGGFAAFVRAFRQSKAGLLGVGIVLGAIAFSFLGPLFYHTDQVHVNLNAISQPPSARHLLGTNAVGNDVLGQLMLGGQSSIEIGLAAALLASILGTVWGAVAGYAGGWLDAVMMRVVDSMIAIPHLLMILLLTSIFGPSTPVLILVIAIVSWLATARLVRGDALSLVTRDFVHAARAAGAAPGWVVRRHIIPNVIGIIVVQTTFEVANAILLLAGLSFLGLGPQPPAANWGGMLSNGLNFVFDGYWWLIYPAGAAIVLTVCAFNMIGDALRDTFEVRLRRR
ncbi:MAG TPA: ABC transporter permease [Streptosporangiaceae bacterium]|nr:ABC transporter permease [Streptosporangiaceae bacterium]